MKRKKYSIWELILYIINFIFNRKKLQEQEIEQINEDLKDKYDEIDKEKEDKQNENLEDRLNNIF